MKYISFALLFLSLISVKGYAESYIYLTNNTMDTLSIHTQQYGHNNIAKGNQWDQLATEVKPLETVKFLRFNRDQGIKWGREYTFETTISGTPESILLRQKLRGTMTFSKMWLSAQQDPWYYDRDIHKQSLTETRDLAFKSQTARASGDDIYYVVHDQSKPQKKANTVTN